MKRILSNLALASGLAALLGGCSAVEFVWAKTAQISVLSIDSRDGKGARVTIANNFSRTVGPFDVQCVFVTPSGVKLRKMVTVPTLAPATTMTIFPDNGATARDGACRISSGKVADLFILDENEKYWKLSGQ